ncbi:MAG: spore coat associated protein CotJA [Bacillota bacterium]
MNGFRKKPLVWGPLPPAPRPDQFPAAVDQDTAPPWDAPVMEAAGTGTTVETRAAAAEPDAPVAEKMVEDAEPVVSAGEEKTGDSTAVEMEAPEERVFPGPGPYPPPAPPGPSCPGMELATAYIPYQRYGPTYSPAEALEKGTLFPELYRPYPY